MKLDTELIRQTMKDMKMSQAELGRRVGVSQNVISVMLRTGKASDRVVKAVMEALDIAKAEAEAEEAEEERRTQAELDLVQRVERLERIVGDLLGMRRIYGGGRRR